MDPDLLTPAQPATPSADTLTVWNTPELDHGFMGRRGGVSRDAYRSLNLAGWIGDDPAAVAENQRGWAAAHSGFRLVSSRQVHGADVIVVDEHHDGIRRPADGMVTRARGIALAVFSADCIPILLADRDSGVVGALHAGWRGVLAGIAVVGGNAMETAGARRSRIMAALGPAIGPCCFEVDASLAERFAESVPGSGRHRRPGRPGKAYFDLRGIVRDQLVAAGLSANQIATVGPCTRCANDRYFSRRGAGGATTGLQMSFIGLRP